MAAGLSSEHARLIRKLETISVLSDAERRALAGLPLRLKSFLENTDLTREGEAPTECCLVVEGLVCRYKVLGAGQRQILSLHLPGDIPDLQSLHLGVMDHTMGSLTAGRAAYLPHAAVRALTDRFPNITAAFWRDSLIDASVTREWLCGIGRRTAHQRIAHLICEVFVRSRALHLIEEKTFEFAITQAELGDALGLSTVHVNRVLQDLRRDELITWRGKSILVQDWERLCMAGDFDAGYLHLLDGAIT
ncbi:MAG: Crp/Fnr family transcriptional regulator [Phenylobacterium sp.]|nr:Crp/Fnr family transcriptional regulator [Phenylobacterium sp.]